MKASEQKPCEDLVIRPSAEPAAQPTPESFSPSYLTHELRAPITAIHLGLEVLQEQLKNRLEADEKQTLAIAIKNTARLAGLVNDIMDYSKIMAGKLKAKKEPCDPRQQLNDAVDGLQSLALAKGVKLIRETDGPLPRIDAEPRRVVQILINLISNAIKYTPARGAVRVSCKVGEREHAGTIVFKVKDTGRGIPAQDIEKIFDMFIQSGANKSVDGGTGLGLTLARLMVKLHGGRIWAESWRQLGATLYFTIPIAREDMRTPVEAYPREMELSGLLVSMSRRFNSFLALFI